MALQNEIKKDYSDVAAIIKWSALGLATVTIVGGGVYYAVNRSAKDKKKDAAYSDIIAVDNKGKSTVDLIGVGKTPAAYASLIHAALKATNWAGIPDTDEKAVYKYLRELNNQYEVALISKQYQALYDGKTLQEGLDDDLDADEYSEAISIIASLPPVQSR